MRSSYAMRLKIAWHVLQGKPLVYGMVFHGVTSFEGLRPEAMIIGNVIAFQAKPKPAQGSENAH